MRFFLREKQEKPLENSQNPDQILYKKIAEEVKKAKNTEINPEKLALEDILLYMAAKNLSLSPTHLAVYGNRMRDFLGNAARRINKTRTVPPDPEILKNRKRFFEFAVYAGAESLARQRRSEPHGFSRKDGENKKEEKLEYAKTTLGEYVRMEKEKRVSAGHFLDEEFKIENLSDDDLNIWLKVIGGQITREEISKYSARNPNAGSRGIFLHAINNLTVPILANR